jgi:hypothetical protein
LAALSHKRLLSLSPDCALNDYSVHCRHRFYPVAANPIGLCREYESTTEQ